ncbi:MAG: hypothetical protein ACK5CA_00615 [Cyanobacteriota bacterium]
MGLTLRDGKALITVKDTGVGIDPSEQKAISGEGHKTES